MSDESELFVFKSRYVRLIRFDRGLCVVYGLTALIPVYKLLSSGDYPRLHIAGAVAITGVACYGWKANTNIINQKTQTERPAYAVTASFVLSRLILAAYGLYLLSSQFTEPAHFSSFLKGVMQGLISLPFAMLLLVAVTYRFLYHISVHFLLKIRSLEQARASLT